MRIGILGSGFGFSTYLPAILKNNWTPVILSNKSIDENYFSIFKFKRQKIKFSDNVSELISSVERIVVARPPKFQFDILQELIEKKNIAHFYLEKPLAPSLETYKQAIKDLIKHDSSFSIAYLLSYADWFNYLKNTIVNLDSNFTIIWEVSPMNNSWKMQSEDGGGLMLFYGTHILSLFFKLGINLKEIEVMGKKDQLFFCATSNKFNIKVYIRKSIEYRFSLINNFRKKTIFNEKTPFGFSDRNTALDARVVPLSKYLADNNQSGVLKNFNLNQELYILGALNKFKKFI